MPKIDKKTIGTAIRSSVMRRALDDNDDGGGLAPYDEPNNKKSRLRKVKQNVAPPILAVTEEDLLTLSPLQKDVFYSLSKKLTLGNQQTTPIFIKELASEINISISSLKKAIQRLEKSGFISRYKYKQGRGGWTIYTVELNWS